ncbi:MAG: hypothetical protein ABI016_13870 [Chthoniobacterales bacterium]
MTLQQIGPDVVATGSGAINLNGLTFFPTTLLLPKIVSSAADIVIGPTISSTVDYHNGVSGPTSFGSGLGRSASSGSGDMVGINEAAFYPHLYRLISVPAGYASDTILSDSVIYSGTTLAALGVTAGTYVWKWGTTANQNFTLEIPPFPQLFPPATITNISTRASVQSGHDVTIAGFIITGTASRVVVIRGLGPTLTNSNVTGVLADPTLGLYDGSGTLIYSNNDWKDTQASDILQSGLAPSFDVESAIEINLYPGDYTAILSGNNGTTGVGLVEVYDIDTDPYSKLTNISTRSFVDAGDDVMIAGFILQPDVGASNTILARAIGPSLAAAQVTDPLEDPEIDFTTARHKYRVQQ